MSRLDWAKNYASLGWRVIPIVPGLKHPPIAEWQNAATTDFETIESWWGEGGRYAEHGIGIACGAESGIWVLDVDVGPGKQGARTLRDLNHIHGKLPITTTAQTGSGGLHLIFKWDPDRPVTNGMASRLGPGLDIRGQGGQIVVAPTIHPNGEPYTWHDQRAPWLQPSVSGPDWLYNIILGLEDQDIAITTSGVLSLPTGVAPEDLEAGVRIQIPAEIGESPADWVRRNSDWHGLLTNDGWTRHSTRNNESWWTRPGKKVKDGHSAVLHEPDGPLVIFSSEVDPALHSIGRPTNDGSAVSLSSFQYLAATQHGGDERALASATRTEMNRLLGPTMITGRPTATVTPSPEAGGETPPEPDEKPPLYVDLASFWDDPEPSKTADMLKRTDGLGLLYIDELNWIHGESGCGKTWVALIACAQLIRQGHHVGWVHYEDSTPALVVTRLKALGLDRDEVLRCFHYHNPQAEALDVVGLIGESKVLGIVHIVIDSVGEAMNMAGVDENVDAEVGPWIRNNPRAFVDVGIGCTCIDHGTKSGTFKWYASGSKRKRAAVTGAGLLIEAEKSLTIRDNGLIRIFMTKDRHGNFAQKEHVGQLGIDHDLTSGHLNWRIHVPSDIEAHEQESAVQGVRRLVENTPGLNSGELYRLMEGRNDGKAELIQHAIDQGLIRMERKGNAQLHYPVEITGSE